MAEVGLFVGTGGSAAACYGLPWSTYFASFPAAGRRSPEVDLEVRSVETDLDFLDILGGAVEAVNEERSSDGGHVGQGTRMA